MNKGDKIYIIILIILTLIRIIYAKMEYDENYIFREFIFNNSYISKDIKYEEIESNDIILKKYNLPKINYPDKFKPLEDGEVV